MRTVDPVLWSSRVKGRRMALARPLKFGKKQGMEARLRDSFRDAIREFLGNCSVEGVKHLVSPDTGKWARHHWAAMLVGCLSCGVLVAALDLAELVAQPPLRVRLQSAQHSIRHLPFPAVALCSYNVISQRALKKLTTYLAARDQNRTYSPAAIRQNLLSFGALLTMTLPQLDLQFMPYLSGAGAGYDFNVTRLMFLLAPSCESLLVKCEWRGQEMPCGRLFATRLTPVGFCCIFNARYDQADYHTPPKILEMVGPNDGLSVILKENYEDFAFIRRPIVGTEVLIFDGSEFPLLEGGAVRVATAWPNTTAHFALAARLQRAAGGLQYYSEAWRGCRLKRAGPQQRLRSYSWCLTECRRRAALQLCGCVPYTLQPRGELICSLNQLSCLNKHREKFLYYYPYGYVSDALSEERQDALQCADCRADCARAVYSAAVSLAQAPRGRQLFRDRFMTGPASLVNVSVLKFFYPTEDQHLYAVQSNSNWYETFASIASQWVVLGVPLVSAAELAFHCTARWRHHYVRRRTMFARLAAPSDLY